MRLLDPIKQLPLQQLVVFSREIVAGVVAQANGGVMPNASDAANINGAVLPSDDSWSIQ